MRLLLLFYFSAILLLVLSACSGEKKSGAGKPRIIGEGNPKDSAVYYNAEIGTIQRSYKKELQGKWNITVMHRQQKAIAEIMNDVSITFADTSILGKAPCNTFYGKYILKGTSVKFSEILSTKMACSQLEQENMFIKLLEQTVSAYSVSDKKLYLRDGASNIVFECEKAE
ncbi:MAG: META domain-containing protein [Chitinophagaceae bacterium]